MFNCLLIKRIIPCGPDSPSADSCSPRPISSRNLSDYMNEYYTYALYTIHRSASTSIKARTFLPPPPPETVRDFLIGTQYYSVQKYITSSVRRLSTRAKNFGFYFFFFCVFFHPTKRKTFSSSHSVQCF